MSRQSGRRPRARKARGASAVGRRFEAEVGPVAHGGHFVARVPAGADGEERVVFVRHALPGERVVLEVTDGTDGDRFWRADAVEVLTPSPDRVTAPCPYAGPGLCGGCDFQHVDLAAQCRLKADVVREQLRRVARLDVEVVVEAVPGDEAGLHWRTRQRYVPLADGRRGMRKHRSHEVVEVDECLLEAPAGPSYDVEGRAFEVADGGFWQVHPGAPSALVRAVLEALRPQPGESVLDLYAGVGLFSRFLLEAVGPEGRVAAVEADPAASALSATNCPACWPGRVMSPRCSPAACPGRGTPRTWWCWTRPAPARNAPSWSRSSPALPEPSPMSPATPVRWPATWRSSPSTATGWPRCVRSTCSR